ncbi:acyltransferase family protein [Isoptericola halotolerans]|uniref:acyltransferase family protein n=1 Tax=Isoptericola halotolerans TaxID=300560 RepID=UPI00388F9D85
MPTTTPAHSAPPPAPAPAAVALLDRPAAPPSAPAPVPTDRDRFVDVVRALGVMAVVALHWLMADASWDGTTLRIGNALAHGAGWTLTWLQPLPLLFFAAGAAAGYRGVPPGVAWWRRVAWWRGVAGSARGAARPVAVLLAAWTVAALVLVAEGVPDGAVWRLVRMVPQPLWFLGVWLVLLACAPLLVLAWRRWRWAAAAVVVALPLGVDALRFGAGLDGAAWTTVVLAWAVPFGAGAAYATDRRDGRRTGPRARALVGAALAALAGAALLIAVGPYPASLVGMPGAQVSNLAPPTAPVVLHAVAMVCLALAARPVLVRWAAGRPVVSAMARRSMTVYLWHLTAMFVVVGTVLLGLGRGLPEAWSTDWWAGRPVWFGAYLLVLVGLVALFGRFESSRAGARQARVTGAREASRR